MKLISILLQIVCQSKVKIPGSKPFFIWFPSLFLQSCLNGCKSGFGSNPLFFRSQGVHDKLEEPGCHDFLVLPLATLRFATNQQYSIFVNTIRQFFKNQLLLVIIKHARHVHIERQQHLRRYLVHVLASASAASDSGKNTLLNQFIYIDIHRSCIWQHTDKYTLLFGK